MPRRLIGDSASDIDRYGCAHRRADGAPGEEPGRGGEVAGRAAGTFAYKLAPQAVEKKMYDEMGRQIVEQMRARGVDAEASVVESPGVPARSEFLRGAALGAGGLALGYGLWRLIWGWR